MSLSLHELIDRCLASVALNSHHDLTWKHRVAIWKALFATFGKVGVTKRALMSLVVTRDLMPLWRSLDIAEHLKAVPEVLLQFAVGIIRNQVPRKSAIAYLDDQLGHVEHVCFEVRHFGHASLIPSIALRTCHDALDDEPYHEIWTLVESGAICDRTADEEQHEVHFLASIAYSGGVAGTSLESDERRHAFWKKWLTEHFAFVIENPTDVILS